MFIIKSKHFLIINAVILNMITAFICNSQKYSITPNDSIIIDMPLDTTIHFTIQQNNVSADILLFKWRKIKDTVPIGWEVNLCDNANCYFERPDSGAQKQTLPSEYGQMSMAFSPNNIEGTAFVQYECWELTTPKKIDTFTWLISSKKSASISENINNSVQIFPNASAQNITIQTEFADGFNYKIVDIIGIIQIEKKVSQSTEVIDMSSFYQPHYILIIEKNNQRIYSQKILMPK